MKLKLQLYSILFILFSFSVSAQEISLYQQFNGRYDFAFFGNTLNPEENSFQLAPAIYTSSSASLNLAPSNMIEKAYLYWAGSGTGDFEVQLNGQTLTPERTFSHQRLVSGLTLDYFSAFKDVTAQVQAFGNGTYTLSDLDVTEFIALHFQRRTNFAGWAIIVIYKNDTLPLNQLNVYDGMQAVPDEINITLSSLNVIDNLGAKIGFLAWEGDVGIQVNETLSINGNLISNPPLNPVNNAFNGTNSFTNSNTLYNMDLDVYDIQNTIAIGDQSAQIKLTSGQDFVMINAIVTKLNSQLPDATIAIDTIQKQCNAATLTVDFTVSNLNSTNFLPAATPIAVYANGQLIETTSTLAIIPVNGSESQQITLVLPNGIPSGFELLFVVDDTGLGSGIVTEIIETNNEFSTIVTLWLSPEFNPLEAVFACNEGSGIGTFDFFNYDDLVKVNATDTVRFFESFEDAENNVNPIWNTSAYSAQAPREIFIRIENENCYSITSFHLRIKNCPPTVYNFVSANNDGTNDTFFIAGLRDIFVDFKVSIYNRWGALVWTGDNSQPDWDGIATRGIRINSDIVPDGTYYYVLHLNDPDYSEPIIGFLYLTH